MPSLRFLILFLTTHNFLKVSPREEVSLFRWHWFSASPPPRYIAFGAGKFYRHLPPSDMMIFRWLSWLLLDFRFFDAAQLSLMIQPQPLFLALMIAELFICRRWRLRDCTFHVAAIHLRLLDMAEDDILFAIAYWFHDCRHAGEGLPSGMIISFKKLQVLIDDYWW